jgi:hypothetical protein
MSFSDGHALPFRTPFASQPQPASGSGFEASLAIRPPPDASSQPTPDFSFDETSPSTVDYPQPVSSFSFDDTAPYQMDHQDLPVLAIPHDEAYSYRHRVTQEPYIDPNEDESIVRVIDNRETYIRHIFAAFFNLNHVKDRPESKYRAKFQLGGEDAVSPYDVEACARIIYAAVVDRSQNGFRGAVACDYNNKDKHKRWAKLIPEDRGMRCEDRMAEVIKCLREWKIACHNVFEWDRYIVELVNTPKYFWYSKHDSLKSSYSHESKEKKEKRKRQEAETAHLTVEKTPDQDEENADEDEEDDDEDSTMAYDDEYEVPQTPLTAIMPNVPVPKNYWPLRNRELAEAKRREEDAAAAGGMSFGKTPSSSNLTNQGRRGQSGQHMSVPRGSRLPQQLNRGALPYRPATPAGPRYGPSSQYNPSVLRKGQTTSNIFGQTHGNTFDQPSANVFDQPSANVFDQPSANAFDQPNANVFGQLNGQLNGAFMRHEHTTTSFYAPSFVGHDGQQPGQDLRQKSSPSTHQSMGSENGEAGGLEMSMLNCGYAPAQQIGHRGFSQGSNPLNGNATHGQKTPFGGFPAFSEEDENFQMPQLKRVRHG